MKNRRLTIFAFVAGAVLAGLLTAGSPAAMADVLTIGGPTPFATVTLTQNGSNVGVVVQAKSGFSLKTGGGSDIFFNPTIVLTANSIEDTVPNLGKVSSNGPTLNNLGFGVATNQNIDGLGTFAFDMTGIGQGQVGSTASVASYDFTVLNATVAQLEGRNSLDNSWGAHFCAASGTNCSTVTFFASTPEASAVTLTCLVLLAFGAAVVRARRRELA